MFPPSDAFACSPLPSNGSRGRHISRGPAVPHLHRYYGLIRCLTTHRPQSLVALDRRLPLQQETVRLSQVPGESLWKRAPGQRLRRLPTTSHDGCPDAAFDRNKSLGIRNDINFGAESSRPTSSLSTLLSRRSPGDRQDSLPAYPLRLWPDWTFTSWIPFERFHRLTSNSPFPSFAWRDIPLIRTFNWGARGQRRPRSGPTAD